MGRVALRAVVWSPGYWGDAVQWAAYTKNRVPHSTLGNKALIEVFLGKTVNRGNLRPFRQKVMAHLYTENKLDARATKASVIGYTETYSIYQVIDMKGKRFINKNTKTIENDEAEEEETILPVTNTTHQGYLNEVQDLHTPERSTTPTFGTPEGQLLIEAAKPTIPEPTRKLRRSERIRDQRTITPWNERLRQGLAGESRIGRVGYDEEHPTNEQTRASPKAYEWSQARQLEPRNSKIWSIFHHPTK